MHLQWTKVLFLEFKIATWGENAIVNFSLRHNLKVFFTGLKRVDTIFWLASEEIKGHF